VIVSLTASLMQVSMAKALSLKWKLPLMVGGLMALLTGAAVLSAWYEVRRANLRVAHERLATVSRQFAERLDAQVENYLEAAARFAASPEVLAAVRAGGTVDTTSLGTALLSGGVYAAELLDANGKLIWEGGPSLAAVRRLEAQQVRDTPHGGPNRGVGRLAAVADTLTFPVIAVVREGEARLGYLVRWIAIRPDARTPAVIADLVGLGAHVYIGSPGGAWTDQAVATPPPPVAAESLQTMRIYDRPGQGRQLAVGAAVPGAPWMIVTEFPMATILAPAWLFLERAVFGAALLLGGGLLIGAWATRRITTPLQQLTEATERMAVAGLPDAKDAGGVEGDEVAQLVAAFRRMAERVETEVAARTDAEAQWRLLFSENPFPMWVVDLETLGFLAVNEAAAERYGWAPDEWATMTIRDIRPPEDLAAMQATLDQYAGGGMRAALVRHRDRNGRVFDVELNGREISFHGRHARLVMGHDVTERQALESQLRQSQKLEAVGRLAGGVAHDFNNNLAVISACAEITILDLAEAGRPTETVEEILRAANQAHALTRQLLTFSRQQVTRPVILDPNAIVRDVERMISRIIEEDVRIVVRTTPDTLSVRVDPGQMQQVLLNLAVNARDALPGGGEITMMTTSRVVDGDSLAMYGLKEPGTYVVISISDNGTGIAPEDRARIFDPFFTTKEPGKGTGLGLATAYGIVTAAGGAISVYSEVGVGSTFRVYLPAAAEGATELSGAFPSTMRSLPRGHETVLLVEDDVAVRSVTANVLTRLGYVVIAVEDAEAALAIAGDAEAALDLVLSDVVMPGMSGPELVDQLRIARPSLQAILMSGYAGDAIRSRGVEANGLPFIEKPFAVATLATTIRAVLDGA
jgi:two-component system cell cycle sensor histidine kinase/response regulator CckA